MNLLDLKVIWRYIVLVLSLFIVPYILLIAYDSFQALFTSEAKADDGKSLFIFAGIFIFFAALLLFRGIFESIKNSKKQPHLTKPSLE